MLITKNNEPTKTIKIGDRVRVPTLFGMFEMTVEEKEDYPEEYVAYNKSKTMGAFLQKADDGYWESDTSFDPKAIVSVKMV